MKTISQFREQYPQYNKIDDQTLTKALHKKYYSDQDFETFSSAFLNSKNSGLGAAFASGIDKVQELGYRAVKGFTDVGEEAEQGGLASVVGKDGALSEWAQEGIDRNVAEQKHYEPTVKSYKDIDSIGDAASYVGELAAGSLPQMAAAATPIGAFGLGGGLSEEAHSSQPDDEKNPTRAVVSGFGQMALERLGIKASLGDVGRSVLKDGFKETAIKLGKKELETKAKDKNFVKDVFLGAVGEGVTEMGQEALAQWGAGKSLSEINGLDEAFVGGFAVGGAFRATTEGASRVMKWNEQSTEIAKNGIDNLVANGTPLEEATSIVRKQLIESGVKRGLSEAEAAASAARTLKLEYGIDDEVFSAFSEAEQNAQNLADMEARAPEFFEKLDETEQQSIDDQAPNTEQQLESEQDVDYDIPTAARQAGATTPSEVAGLGDLLTSPSQQSIKDLEKHGAPSVEDMVKAAPHDKSPTPMDRFSPIKFQHEGEVELADKDTKAKSNAPELPGAVIDGEVIPEPKQINEPPKQIVDKDIIFAPDNSGIIVKRDNTAFESELEAMKSIQARKAIRAGMDVEPTEWGDGYGLKVEQPQTPETASNEAVVDQGDDKSIEQSSIIDQKAHEAATSPLNGLPEPTQAQKEAGNYKKGKVRIKGLDIAIENPKGSVRKGIDSEGNEWSNEIHHHYGDIKGTNGADNDPIDVFIGDNTESDDVFVIDQTDPKTGEFDEHKVMLGFDSEEEAKQAYLKNYDEGWQGLGAITPVKVDAFKEWINKPRKTKKPFHEPKENNSQTPPEAKDNKKLSDSQLTNGLIANANKPDSSGALETKDGIVWLEPDPDNNMSYVVVQELSHDPGNEQSNTIVDRKENGGYSLSEASQKAKDIAAEPKKKSIKNKVVSKGKVFTPKGREIDVEYQVVEAKDLITSNTDQGKVNPKYPSQLQPRDRTRASSEIQINDIANNLKPELLGENASSSDGAPMISESGVVESGNGRTLAIKRAYKNGKASKYREHLKNTGIDVYGFKQPVLVRVRKSQLSQEELVAYTKESNERTTLSMSVSEQSKADSEAINRIISEYEPGDIGSAKNRSFIRKFMQSVSQSEQAELVDSSGQLSQQGRRRVESAMLHSAYESEQLVNDVFETNDTEIKSIGNALLEASGAWAKMRNDAPKDYDLTNSLLEAVDLVKQARRDGKKLAELVNQEDIFAGEVAPEVKVFLGILYKGPDFSRARSKDKVVEALNEYAKLAQSPSSSDSLFGDELPPVPPKELLEKSNETNEPEIEVDTTSPAGPSSEGSSGKGQRSHTSEDGIAVASREKSEKIDDFGEVLQDAAKHKYTISEKFNEDIDVKTVPLSASFPRPDYKKLVDEGVDKRVLAFIAHLRASIKNKPRQTHKLQRWTHQVSEARQHVKKLLEIGSKAPELLIDNLMKNNKGSSELKYLPYVLDLAKDMDPDKIEALGNFTISKVFYSKFRDQENVNKWVVTNKSKASGFGGMGNTSTFDSVEAAQKFVKINASDTFENNGKKLAKFDMWRERGKPGVVFVGKKLGPNKFIELKQFSKLSDASDYIRNNNEELVADLKKKRQSRSVRRADNTARIGIDHRGGKNVTPEQFDKTFGFRGVQFGNWVEGGKRQEDLNNAYDGLMDLATIINVPPSALSFNGELGLAFGARGKGGKNSAMAHFEPDNIVINLTKKQGAGSLAHEWFHALDNYFARLDGLDSGSKNSGEYMTEHSRKRAKFDKSKGSWRETEPSDFPVRIEVYKAFKAIKDTIDRETKLVERSRVADGLRSKDYWSLVREISARSFERYVIGKLSESGYESDYLANIVSEEAHNAANEIFGTDEPFLYPLAAEMDAVNRAYDGLFETLKVKKTDKGMAFYRAENPSSSIDSSSTVPKGVPLNVVQSIAEDFIASYNGNINLDVHVRNTQEELYGPEATIEEYGRIKGAYDPDNGVLTLAAANMSSRADVRATLRHEILGHYALDTFKAQDKQPLFNQIIASQNEPSLKEIWDKIKTDKIYSKQSIDVQAEEVFAYVIENGRSVGQKLFDYIHAWLKSMIRKTGLAKGEISAPEIRNLAEVIAKQIKKGKRKRKFNRKTNLKFRSDQAAEERLSQIVIPDETMTDRALRTIQDKFQRLLVIQRKLPVVNEENNAYLAEEAFHGKAGNDIHQLQVKYVDEIPKIMSKHDLTQDEVDLYLIAKHARERNAYIDTINPELDGAGSGMTNEDADAILNKAVLEGKSEGLEEVSDMVQSMLEYSRNLIVEHGLESQDVIDGWQKQYNSYVPLKGYANDELKQSDDGKKFKTGKGFNIKGRESMKAMGRRSLAESPLLHTINDTTKAIVRAHKNDVGQTFLKLVNDNPNPELWQIFSKENPDMRRGKDKDGMVTWLPMSDHEMRQSDDYFKTKVDGEERYIKIHDPLLHRAMMNLGVDQMSGAIQLLSKFTRTLSALVTSWNPEFMLTNATRDIQAAVANVLAEREVADGKLLGTQDLATKIVKSIPKAMAAVRRGVRNNDYTGTTEEDADYGEYFKEFLEAGAKTGWVHQKTVDELANGIKGAISREGKSPLAKIKKAGMVVADFVHDYNDIVENATRFSAYYHARKQGVSVKQAASMAKNITINFNRKGEISNTLNAFFMFANASVQGTANMMRALATPKDRSKAMWDPQFYNLTQKLAIGAIGSTVAMAALMRELGGEDEDGVPFYDKVPAHVKATNFVIMLGGKDYFAFPMPYGYNMLAAVGHSIDNAVNGKPISSVSTELFMSALGAFSPIGAAQSNESENAFVRTITPTIAKPFTEIAVNENFFGGQIYPSQNGYSAAKSDAHLGTKYTWEWAKGLAEWMNDVTGGNEYISGGIDVAPQSIQHFVKFIGGGVLQFGARWQDLAVKSLNGQEVAVNDVPFYRRFYKQLNPKASISEFYQNRDLLNKHAANVKSLKGNKRSEYRKEFASELKLHRKAMAVEKQLRALNKQKRAIEASSIPESKKQERIDNIDNRKVKVVYEFTKLKHELGLKYL